jgi:1-acyl-sn-glycerol-3-phosphate acyltransferase
MDGNPPTGLAPIRAQVYKDPRPAAFFDRFHERTRTREPDFVYEVVRLITTLYGHTALRLRAVRAESVPASGPVILAPNHFSFLDHFFVGAALRRKVHFMAKSQLFRFPIQEVFTHGGVFPVRRGHRDEEAFATAMAILDRGGSVAMYPEAGRSRTGRLSDTVKPGVGRLALQSGVPVVPAAIHGSSKVRNWRRGQFPQVTVQYGDPLRYEVIEDPSRDQAQAVAEEIFAEVRTLYADIEDSGRRALLTRARDERRARAAASA